MGHKRGLVVLLVAVVLMVGWPTAADAAAAIHQAPDPSITTACTGTTSGTTFTLTTDCDTTAPLTVPDGFTVNGAGHIITVHDPPGGFFVGGVVTNAGTAMNVENLTIQGTGFAFNSCAQGVQTGIFFNDAGGFANNVTVLDITEHSGCNFGLGIRANALAGVARTVTITDATVTGYQRSGIVSTGMMTLNVSNSTIGPPDDAGGRPAQNGVEYQSGATGSVTNSSVVGTFFPGTGAASTAFLMFGASNVTLADNTITGVGTDIGVSLTAGSTGIVLDNNAIDRSPPPAGAADPFGIGVQVAAGSSATLICNTFSGWNTNLDGTTQPPCTTVTTFTAPSTVASGEPVSLTAEVSCPAAPTGTVSFFDSSTSVGTATLSSGSSTATLTLTDLTPGSHTFTAQYNGDQNCADSVSAEHTVTVDASPTPTPPSTPTPAPVPTGPPVPGLPNTGHPPFAHPGDAQDQRRGS
jgi:hypothetical protein